MARTLSVFLGNRDVLATLAVLLVAGGVLGWAAAARAGRPRALGVLAAWSVAVVLAATAVPDVGYVRYRDDTWSAARVTAMLAADPVGAATAWTTTAGGWLNVVLYLPAGLAVAAVTRRPVLAAGSLVGLSVVVELVQAASATRVGTLSDVIPNALGAALGAVVAAAARRAVSRGGSRPARRRRG